MPIVVVTGSPGAGKTTLLERLRGFNGLEIVNLGSVMARYAIEKGYVKTKDELKAHDEVRFLEKDPKMMEELQTHAFTSVGAMRGKVLLDTHVSVKAGKRYMPGLPYRYIKLLSGLAGFIYIDVDTDTVIKRREADKKRVRMDLDALEIDAQRIINLSELSYHSAYAGVPLYIIENAQGKLDESEAELKNAVVELFG